MSAPDRKASGRNPEALHSTINQPEKSITATSPKGRRAVTSLWYAIRTISGAALTPDDLALIYEALSEISEVLQ